MTYPPNGPQHGYPEPGPGYPNPNTETQSIPHSALPQHAAQQSPPPQESSLQGLLQDPPAEYVSPPPEYTSPPPEYAGPPAEYASPPPEYAGPPPGYPPAGYARPRRSRAPMPRVMIAIWVLAAISIAGVALGLTIKDHDINAWRSVHAWGALAILGAVLTAAPAFGAAAHVAPVFSWQAAVAGAGTLAFFWILFVLPSVGSNTTLLATVGVVAGIVAAWIAPGRPVADKSDAPTW